MALMRGNRFQFGLTLLTGLFLLAALFAILLYAVTPETPAARGPILLASFIAILIGSLLCILFLLRWLLRPYNQLLGEAERASTQSQVTKSHDEAEFVLETFQSVVAQLQEQRKELEQLSAQASERATSAEKFSERIVASLPSALIAFDGSGLSMAINAPGRALMEIDGKALGQSFQTLFENYAELKEMIEVRNLSEMVTAFLNFARPHPLQLEEVCLADLISECAMELKPLFQERQVELLIDETSKQEVVVANEPLTVGADERKLRQAILNLLRNAAEAIPEEHTERSVHLRTVREADQAGRSWCLIDILNSS